MDRVVLIVIVPSREKPEFFGERLKNIKSEAKKRNFMPILLWTAPYYELEFVGNENKEIFDENFLSAKYDEIWFVGKGSCELARYILLLAFKENIAVKSMTPKSILSRLITIMDWGKRRQGYLRVIQS